MRLKTMAMRTQGRKRRAGATASGEGVGQAVAEGVPRARLGEVAGAWTCGLGDPGWVGLSSGEIHWDCYH